MFTTAEQRRYLAPHTVLPLIHKVIHNVVKHREVSWLRQLFELGWQVVRQREGDRLRRWGGTIGWVRGEVEEGDRLSEPDNTSLERTAGGSSG